MSRRSRPDIGELPKIPKVDEDIRWWVMWEHIRFARSHGKRIPLKPRRRLTKQEAKELRRNLEPLAHRQERSFVYGHGGEVSWLRFTPREDGGGSQRVSRFRVPRNGIRQGSGREGGLRRDEQDGRRLHVRVVPDDMN